MNYWKEAYTSSVLELLKRPSLEVQDKKCDTCGHISKDPLKDRPMWWYSGKSWGGAYDGPPYFVCGKCYTNSTDETWTKYAEEEFRKKVLDFFGYPTLVNNPNNLKKIDKDKLLFEAAKTISYISELLKQFSPQVRNIFVIEAAQACEEWIKKYSEFKESIK